MSSPMSSVSNLVYLLINERLSTQMDERRIFKATGIHQTRLFYQKVLLKAIHRSINPHLHSSAYYSSNTPYQNREDELAWQVRTFPKATPAVLFQLTFTCMHFHPSMSLATLIREHLATRRTRLRSQAYACSMRHGHPPPTHIPSAHAYTHPPRQGVRGGGRV